MSLTSSSTRANALAQYNDNLVWEGSATKAAAALEAIRWLLVNRPSRIAQGERSLDYESLADEKRRLEEYIEIASTASTARMATFTQGRPRM